MKRKLFLITIAALFMLTGLFAGGNKEVPEVPPVSSGTQYISPNGDGVQDSATLAFTAKVYVKSKEGYIPEYGIQIFNESGKLVHEVVEKEPSDVNWFFALFRGYDLFELEKEITWDGMDKSGKQVTDGIYKVKLYVVDSSDNRSEVDVENFIVDVLPPEAEITAPPMDLFSPNGDGVADVYIIQQTGSEENEWKGSFLNAAGTVVRSYSWTDSAPGDVLWDGKNDQGTKVDDGIYSYSLKSTDLAGNESEEYTIEEIVLNARTPAISLEVDNAYFSPNGDGVKDTVTVSTSVENSDEVVSWSGSILSDNQKTLAVINAEGGVPESYLLTGYSENGERLPEGFYTIRYTVTYDNGFSTSAERRVRLDVTKPEVEIRYDHVFSPNGDGQNDFNDIAIRPSENVSWEGQILDSSANVLFQGSGNEIIRQFRWDGYGPDGQVLPDGAYFVKGVFTDPAGNRFVPDPIEVDIDNRPVSIAMTTPKGFSPNSDGEEDVLPVILEPTLNAEVANWKVSFENLDGVVMKSYTGTGELPDTVFWDGSQEGSSGLAAEGFYSAYMKTVYAKGDVVELRSDSFTLDNTPPKVRLAVTSKPFAQSNGDIEGEVTVAIEVEEETGVAEWTMDILNSKGEVIRSYAGNGDPADQISWNGTVSNGSPADPQDNYDVRVTITDMGGNSATYTEALPFDIAIIVRNGKYYILTPNIIFGAYKSALNSAGEVMLKNNNDSIERAAEILKRYPDYNLVLEGHALNIYLDGPREDREEAILVPLTEKRAAVVRDALIEAGIDPDRISIEAFGGEFPIVSVTDKMIWWKNRRVEFRLEK